MVHRRSRILLVALVVATVAGCSSGGSSGSDTTTTRQTTTTAAEATTTTVPDGPTTLELVDAGAEPRTRLRLAYEAGTASAIAMTTSSRATTTGPEGSGLDDTSTSRSTLTLTHEVVRSGSTGATVRSTISDPSDELAELDGLSTTVRLSPRGVPTSIDTDPDRDTPTSVRAVLRSLAASPQAFGTTLPVEPVGIGAEWVVRSTILVSGIEMQATSRYHLLAIDGPVLTYRAETTATAADQPIGAPDESGTSGRLVNADIRGSVSGTLRLDRPGGTSTATSTGTEHLEVTGPDDTVEVTVSLDTRSTTEPVGTAPSD